MLPLCGADKSTVYIKMPSKTARQIKGQLIKVQKIAFLY